MGKKAISIATGLFILYFVFFAISVYRDQRATITDLKETLDNQKETHDTYVTESNKLISDAEAKYIDLYQEHQNCSE